MNQAGITGSVRPRFWTRSEGTFRLRRSQTISSSSRFRNQDDSEIRNQIFAQKPDIPLRTRIPILSTLRHLERSCGPTGRCSKRRAASPLGLRLVRHALIPKLSLVPRNHVHAKPTGSGNVHRKHLHRAAGAPTGACFAVSLDRRAMSSSSN